MANVVLWREEEDRVTKDLPLYEQLEAIIRDVGKGMPFARAVKANDFGLGAAKQRYIKGDRLLECYREYTAQVEETGNYDNNAYVELFDKYELAKQFRDNIDLIPQSISVQFYIRINKSQGEFIRNMIDLIKTGAANGGKLNYNAAWLLSRVFAGDFGEAMRGQVDIDVGVSDKARTSLSQALDSLMESKQDKFKQGNCSKNANVLKKQEAKIENGERLESNE